MNRIEAGETVCRGCGPIPDEFRVRRSSDSRPTCAATVRILFDRAGGNRMGLVIAALLVWQACAGDARAQPRDGAKLPFGEQPIDYFGPHTDDHVARLRGKLDAGETRLEFREGTGWLPSLLHALDVPVASQMLVFAKNSVHARLIGPENPRALYFNDEVYIGWVPGAPFIEISAVDPQKGAIFYSLRQEAEGGPRIVREESCLLCHASASALGVPGHLVRSFLTDPQGNPTRGIARVDHDTPFARRWGGWYVTGDWGGLSHQGNLATAAALAEYDRQPEGPGRAVRLKEHFDPARYLQPHSDVVALLVHDDQTQFHNLVTRAGFEARLAARKADDAPQQPAPLTDAIRAATEPTETEERLVRYLLQVDAPALEHSVLGSSGFEAWYAKQGRRDARGRSLRQFDLETRLFRYPCSDLIRSRPFAGLPDTVRRRIYARLAGVLTARNPPAPYDRLIAADRQAVVEILRETHADLPAGWPAPHGALPPER